MLELAMAIVAGVLVSVLTLCALVLVFTYDVKGRDK